MSSYLEMYLQEFFEAQIQLPTCKSGDLGFSSSSHTDKVWHPSNYVISLNIIVFIHKMNLKIPPLMSFRVILKIKVDVQFEGKIFEKYKDALTV